MQTARQHPHILTAGAFALAVIAVVAIGAAYGFSTFIDAWRHPDWPWLILCLCADTLAVGAYAVAYGTIARVDGGRRLEPPLLVRLVLAGFGPFTVAGGFGLDRLALATLEGEEEPVAVRVLGLAALEWALLAPAACVSAIILLASGDPRPMPSVLWPWAIAVPIGFAIALPPSMPRFRRRIAGDDRGWLDRSLRGVELILKLTRSFSSCWLAWLGGAVYWALDIATLYGATRFIGLHLNLGELVLAYATGYALTRRSLPLGGAGVTEALMTFSLHWMGQPVAPALAAVVVYRVFNFALPAIPQLRVRRTLQPLLGGAKRGPARASASRATGVT